MPARVDQIKQKLTNLPPKTKWVGLGVFGLLSAAFAAYGVAPESAPSSAPAGVTIREVTELIERPVIQASSAAAVAAPSVTPSGPSAATPAAALPDAFGAVSLAPRLDRFIQSERVRKGDTMASLLSRMGANDPELIKYITKTPEAKPFAKMQTGRLIQAEISPEGKIFTLHYNQPAVEDEDGEVTPGVRWSLSRSDAGFAVREEAAKLHTYTDTKVFAIRSTLADASASSRVPESVANQIVDLFSDVIDFEKEARRGDRVKVIYETVADPQSLEAPVPGRVLAVEWTSGKRLYTAVWFGDAKHPDNGEYFAFDGKSLSKSFLRYPIEFARISSEFAAARKHPIFQDWRAHKGVDFAAPLGTKVRATGDGLIEFLGVQRGYGNVITVKHGKYSTVYAHLNEFTPGLKEGSKVRQGDVIGFVGRTGFATGPHLHYEFKVNGEQANPLTAELPGRAPLAAADRKALADRATQVKSLMAQLGSNKLALFQ